MNTKKFQFNGYNPNPEYRVEYLEKILNDIINEFNHMGANITQEELDRHPLNQIINQRYTMAICKLNNYE